MYLRGTIRVSRLIRIRFNVPARLLLTAINCFRARKDKWDTIRKSKLNKAFCDSRISFGNFVAGSSISTNVSSQVQHKIWLETQEGILYRRGVEQINWVGTISSCYAKNIKLRSKHLYKFCPNVAR